MICEKCGEPIAQDALYCENCGARGAAGGRGAGAFRVCAEKHAFGRRRKPGTGKSGVGGCCPARRKRRRAKREKCRLPTSHPAGRYDPLTTGQCVGILLASACRCSTLF
ncbi:MAG: zinc-ribbon domain-containing protein [Ruthenibacterium lactatiformans]